MKVGAVLSIGSVLGIVLGAGLALSIPNPFSSPKWEGPKDLEIEPFATTSLPFTAQFESAPLLFSAQLGEASSSPTTQKAQGASASFEVNDLLCELEVGAKLTDAWTPLLSVRMGYSDYAPAYRVLESLDFEIIEEPGDGTTLAEQAGELEFGVFVDSGPDGIADGIFDPLFDGFYLEGVGFIVGAPFLSWAGDGSALAEGSPQDASAQGDLSYSMDFVHDLSDVDADPETIYLASKSPEVFPDGTTGAVERYLTAGPGVGNGYVIAVRARRSVTIATPTRVVVTNAEMTEVEHFEDADGGAPILVPVENSEDLLDAYNPVFAMGEILADSCTTLTLADGDSADGDSADGTGSTDPGGIVVSSFDARNASEKPQDSENGVTKQDDEDMASFDLSDGINACDLARDQHGLVPLMDWVPLFSFVMAGDEYGDGAGFFFRTLERLTFNIIIDPDRLMKPYSTAPFSPIISDLEEFAIFLENPDPPDFEFDGCLDTFESEDFNLVARWDNTGFPLGTATGFFGIQYNLDFSNLGSLTDANFPIQTGNVEDGLSYVVCFRTSATWPHELTLAYEVVDALMFPFPLDDMGQPVDSYGPDFPMGEVFDDVGTAYSSSFEVYDITGGFQDAPDPDIANYWVHRLNLYSPQAEFTRPRFDLGQDLFDFVTGQLLNVRKVLPLDTWVPLIGLNLHSTAPTIRGDRKLQFFEDNEFLIPQTELIEVNVVLTDIGGDPFGEEGSGGFDPNSGLEHIYDSRFTAPILFVDPLITGNHYGFNGLWVYEDTNDNGLFDPPVYNPATGVVDLFDLPMDPDYPYTYVPQWEYIPFPPGGGDPWWKMKLRFNGGSYNGPVFRDITDFPCCFFVSGPTTGFIEHIPEATEFGPGSSDGNTNPEGPNELVDYFVVIRTDSGLKDISLLDGDGTAIKPGADFKAFIEPRRFDTIRGTLEGGIHLDSMIPLSQNFGVDPQWQNDARWGPLEPWWPQRQHTQITTKSSRVGFEVHDLVMLYETRSPSSQLLDIPIALTGPGDWLDPFGLSNSFFLNGQFLETVFLSFILNIVIDDTTAFLVDTSLSPGHHPAFETAPFFNPFIDSPPEGPRSQFFPAQLPLPPSPEFSTWPGTPAASGYPHLSNWPLAGRQTRMLKQRIDAESGLTAMLGFNFAGTNDPIVNRINVPGLQEIVVAFWGPDFDPSDLLPLDPTGTDLDSGVMLWADSITDIAPDGAFRSTPVTGFLTNPFLSDLLIPLINLEWSTAAEPIDLDGDRFADDINGDGVVDSRDNAWVLILSPSAALSLPLDDDDTTLGPDGATVETSGGDDAFLVIRTSKTISRGERFRALVPAYLPARSREAGVRLTVLGSVENQSLVKTNPEEQVEFDFFSHDMMEANVPVDIVNLAPRNTQIVPSGPAFPIFGIDMATNRPEGTIETGTAGTGGVATLIDPVKNWPVDAFAGKWVVDKTFTTFQIASNTATRLNLISGTPATGAYRIVQEPTFFEQLVVEFHRSDPLSGFRLTVDFLPLSADQRVSGVAIYRDNDAHPLNRNGVFDEGIDLPLILDDPPVTLGLGGNPDAQVKFVFSSPGTDNWPELLTSQPHLRQWVPDTFGRTEADADFGPDFFVVIRASDKLEVGHDFGAALVSWGPDTPTAPDPDTFTFPPPPIQPVDEFNKFNEFPFGSRALGFITFLEKPETRYYMIGTKAFNEPEPFVVPWIRSMAHKKVSSSTITARDIIIGPDTIIIDSATPSQLPAVVPAGGFEIVIRGDNFGPNPIVTLTNYNAVVIASTNESIDVRLTNVVGVVPSVPVTLIVRNPDKNESRSRTGLFTVSGISPQKVEILSVSPSQGGIDDFPVTIRGRGFNAPSNMEIFFGQTLMPIRTVNPVGNVLESGENGIADTNALRDFGKNWTVNLYVDRWLLDASMGTFRITANSANELTLEPAVRIPVSGPYSIVDGTQLNIVLDYPSGGLAQTGRQDVTVMNLGAGSQVVAQDTLLQGFTFLNDPLRPCFIATAAYGTPFAAELDTFRRFRDGVLLKSPFGVALVEAYYTNSPAAAEFIAQRPFAARIVRGALTPLAWILKWPLGALAIAIILPALYLRRRRTQDRGLRDS